jgi:hypothetical protein
MSSGRTLSYYINRILFFQAYFSLVLFETPFQRAKMTILKGGAPHEDIPSDLAASLLTSRTKPVPCENHQGTASELA